MNVLDKDNADIRSMFDLMKTTSCKLDELFADYRPIINGERYITEGQLEGLLQVCDNTLLDYRNQGILSYVQVGKKIMYIESDVEKMLAKAYVEAWRK